MKTTADPIIETEQMNVLVVGNNPTELGHVFESLSSIPGKLVTTEIAFDLRSIFERLSKFKPAFILIDDNIGSSELKTSVGALLNRRKTKSIPIIILKNSNYHEAINTGVLNYVLKKGLTAESLYRALKNSLKFMITQRYLYQSYKERTGQLRRFLQNQI
jgi:CheY-like chemotaxis protein